MTLQHQGASPIPAVGDRFTVQDVAAPASVLGIPNASYLTADGTAYLPDVRGNIGNLSYRMVLQLDPQAGALKITHLEENNAANTNPATGSSRLVDSLDSLNTQIRDTEQPATCSKATLKGVYSSVSSGLYKTAAGQTYPYTVVGFISYDGAGNWDTRYTLSLDRKETTSKGTYDVSFVGWAKRLFVLPTIGIS